MKLLVNTAAYWPDEETFRNKSWLYLKSCDRFDIHPIPYGLGSTHYQGWGIMRVAGQLECLKQHGDSFTHVLYTDSQDALFLAPLTEIIDKYASMNSPPLLFTASDDTNDLSIYADLDLDWTTPLCYPAQTCFIGEVSYVIECFSKLGHLFSEEHAHVEAWKEGWFRPVLDSSCRIFQNHPELRGHENCIVKDGRVYNPLTDSYPSILHFGGGHSSWENGKDDRIIPWAKKLGILPCD